ncbi:antibiotic biosynthesis monooxygenase [Bacillus tianshenii]|nr:antibiotic biosynthesis monooxygenase [Bacillus tianshenii]
MNIYIAYGTGDYLQTLKKQHPLETLRVMTNADRTILVHESNKETFFKEGHSYEVIDQSGELPEEGFAVLNNIPVRDEGRPLFEERFQNRARLIEHEPGFQAIRVLRPLDSDTYIILTVWQDEKSFKGWQKSNAYDKAHKKRGTSEGIDNTSIFSGPSYVTNYHIVNDEE